MFPKSLNLILCAFVLIGPKVVSGQRSGLQSKPVRNSGGTQNYQNSETNSTDASDDQLNTKVVALFNAGQYKQALPIAKQLLASREKSSSPDYDRIAIAQINLAEILVRLNYPDEAAKLYVKMLKESEARNGPNSILNTPILDRLAFFAYNRGESKRTEDYYQRSLNIRTAVDDANSDDLALARNNLAEFYRFTERFEKAEPLYLLAIASRDKGLPDTKEVLKKSLHGYRCLLYETARKEEFRKFVKTLNLDEADRFDQKFGEDFDGKAIVLPRPKYPPVGLRYGVEGVAVIRVTIDESGKVIAARDACEAIPEFARSAIDALRSARFPPAVVNGKPIVFSDMVVYRFKYF